LYVTATGTGPEGSTTSGDISMSAAIGTSGEDTKTRSSSGAGRPVENRRVCTLKLNCRDIFDGTFLTARRF
jgi:hypothetical protein